MALSGESADEVFGGYPWFHDPKAVDAATFPWLATTGGTFDGTQVLDADLLERLNLLEFQADSYAQAIDETPVHNGEDAVERRMREISYLHLTRFVQFLLTGNFLHEHHDLAPQIGIINSHECSDQP